MRSDLAGQFTSISLVIFCWLILLTLLGGEHPDLMIEWFNEQMGEVDRSVEDARRARSVA